jgi:D-alanine transfer protein
MSILVRSSPILAKPERSGKLPHLLPASLAALIVAASLAIGNSYANQVENSYVHAMVSFTSLHLRPNSVVQQAALQQPDLLLLYGSSELTTGGPYDSGEFFKTYPTGFAVFEVYGPAADAIVILQETATLGSGLKGKKIVISLSPEFFAYWDKTPAAPYEANFSLRNANEFVFSPELDFSLKQAAAKRMLEYPRTLRHDPLLKFALETLADDGVSSRALYYATFPLGKLHLLALQLQEHWRALGDIQGDQALSDNVARQTSRLDWVKLVMESMVPYEQINSDDPFGFPDTLWQQNKSEWSQEKNDLSDAEFERLMQGSKEWDDLSLLLTELRELGAQPLIISSPWDGLFMDYRGVSAAARTQYYERLRQTAQAYNMPVVTFEDHEYDKFFFLDVGHPSMKGWVYYDQALDAFYHGTLH